MPTWLAEATPLAVAATALLTLALGAASAWAAPRLAEQRPVIGPRATLALQAALGFAGALAAPGPGAALVSAALSAALLTLAIVDVTELRLPDAITLPLIVGGLGVAAVEHTGVGAHAAGALAGWAALAVLAAAFHRATGRQGIGMGDAKLLAAAGAWCGWAALPSIVLVGCLIAFAWIGLRMSRAGAAAARAPLPFGAPLALAFWLVRLAGAPL